MTVGPYGVGEELVFGTRVSGNEFRMGPAGRNPDGKPHAVVDFDAAGTRPGRAARGGGR